MQDVSQKKQKKTNTHRCIAVAITSVLTSSPYSYSAKDPGKLLQGLQTSTLLHLETAKSTSRSLVCHRITPLQQRSALPPVNNITQAAERLQNNDMPFMAVSVYTHSEH